MNNTQKKANTILQIICAAFLLISVRVFYLATVEKDALSYAADKPKKRFFRVPASRGQILDRFHIPLATNKICYKASICYSDFNQFPRRAWTVTPDGLRQKTSPRSDYILALSKKLGEVLDLDPKRIEDIIHCRASLFPHVPYKLSENISEKQYFTLKMLEKDYPGLLAEIDQERHYPFNKIGCHLLGRMGSIGKSDYLKVAEEIYLLEEMIDEAELFGGSLEPYHNLEELKERLFSLKNKAYTLQDKIGKSGVEKQFEEELRGSFGLDEVEVNNQGKPINKSLKTKDPTQGKDITLSISIELQKTAEELLIQAEKDLEGKSIGVDPIDKIRKPQKQPWIKGGAIVAMDPKNGEILALASTPRFDPNDFIKKSNREQALNWIEGELSASRIWDGHAPLKREWPLDTKRIFEEKKNLSWDFFLDQILPLSSSLRAFFERVNTLKLAIEVQEDFQSLVYAMKNKSPLSIMEELESLNPSQKTARPAIERLKRKFKHVNDPKDRLFAIDLCRLIVYSVKVGDELLLKCGSMKLSTYRELNQEFCRAIKREKEKAKRHFHSTQFSQWEKENKKSFLKEKRKEEKQKKTYGKPYLEHLDKKEKELFDAYWEENHLTLTLKTITESAEPNLISFAKEINHLPQELQLEFLQSFRSFEELQLPLYTQTRKIKTEKELAAAFYPKGGFGYMRSYAFQSESPQGSIFKLLTAYEGLRQGHNPSIIDEATPISDPKNSHKQPVAFNLKKEPYFRYYKGGRLPKSAAKSIGKIDVVGALERSSNPYFAILAGDFLQDPDDLNLAALNFNFGCKTGLDLPGEAKGHLPIDLSTNRTGLYSYAIGQHTLLNTPLQSAILFGTIANGGAVLKPQIIKGMKEVKKKVPMPFSIQQKLLAGMDQCVWGEKGCARPTAIASLLSNSIKMREYQSLKHQMIGKTSTAEVLFNPDMTPSSQAQMYKNIWFGCTSFEQVKETPSETLWQSPELVVVVFLRFGNGGKTAAPIAAKMIHAWREIQRRESEKLASKPERTESKY